MSARLSVFPEHLHNVETPFYCPQTLLNLTFQCRDDISEIKQTLWDCKELFCLEHARWSWLRLHCVLDLSVYPLFCTDLLALFSNQMQT